jgi:hypothetical protein
MIRLPPDLESLIEHYKNKAGQGKRCRSYGLSAETAEMAADGMLPAMPGKNTGLALNAANA